MKTLYHIPTEQFGFVEIELEKDSVEDAIEGYNALRSPEMPSGSGLDPTAWRMAYDGYKELHTMPSELYEKMNSYQQFAIQEEKKYYKRTNKEQ